MRLVAVVAVALALAQCTHAQVPLLDTAFAHSEAFMQQSLETAVHTVVRAIVPGLLPLKALNVSSSGLTPTGTAASCPQPSAHHGDFVTGVFKTIVSEMGGAVMMSALRGRPQRGH